jgi:hypothetical protein
VFGHAPRIVNVIERAAAASGGFRGDFGETPLVPELHGQAGDVVAIALEQGGDGGTIDTTGHGDGD